MLNGNLILFIKSAVTQIMRYVRMLGDDVWPDYQQTPPQPLLSPNPCPQAHRLLLTVKSP